ncbi:MAG TPA: hypothetical protein VNG51_01595 [Ktedonobacteraceae bacterium]|nr:hypothetical protein [Ktedonobacteraceae bacterium]
MNKYLQQPLPLVVISVTIVILLVCVVIIFGVTTITRGPIEMLSALLLGAILLLVRALLRR